jgi:hypothetical protein
MQLVFFISIRKLLPTSPKHPMWYFFKNFSRTKHRHSENFDFLKDEFMILSAPNLEQVLHLRMLFRQSSDNYNFIFCSYMLGSAQCQSNSCIKQNFCGITAMLALIQWNFYSWFTHCDHTWIYDKLKPFECLSCDRNLICSGNASLWKS